MKAGLLAAVLFALWASPAFAVEKRHHYGHLPIHVRGTLQGWQTHEDVFYARAGQRILIKTHSARMKWLVISVTPLSTNTPIFKSGETQGASQEVTAPAFVSASSARASRIRSRWPGNAQRVDDRAANKVLFDNLIEVLWSASPVPDALWIDDRNRPARTNSEAVRFGALDAASLAQAELLQPFLEMVPGSGGQFVAATGLLAAFHAEENVTARRVET
ncbi:hypothetical protein [Methylocystis sp. Sn-Cys]|uniref:hypothetical protein n=1 Tax=Methylocystis sp. Sn-Cys TaxID=1701263 RepID=UPI001FF01549|nr:hypothetical protein [Methylocystis sp. Sn-Cys]